MPLAYILQLVFGVQSFQIEGPGWIDDTGYDLTATFSNVHGMKSAERYRLLQPFVVSQLKIKWHREKRSLPDYVLVVAKGGPRLKAEPGCCDVDFHLDNGAVHLSAQTDLKVFADALSRNGHLDRSVVIDQTGLTGDYRIDFVYAAPMASPEGMSNAPSIFSAVEALGLRLVPRPVSFDIIVIDSADRNPTGN